MSDCSKCIFKGVYRDMGASMDVCTLVSDITLANAEIKVYTLLKCCKCYLSSTDLRDFVLINDEDDVANIFNYIMLNKE